VPILNPDFRDADGSTGVPRAWRLVSLVQAERVAGFGEAPARGVEDFERWFHFMTALELGVRAFFDPRPEGFEDFSEGFGTDTFAWHFEDARSERHTFDGGPAETFERGFSNDAYWVRWADVDAAPSVFGGAPSESFDRGFKNDVFAWSLLDVTTSHARFTDSAEETFRLWPTDHERRT
jgi:hypothetical protein